MNMDAKTIFPSKYIKAEDLQGKSVTVQIAAIEIEEIGKQKDRRPVLYFRGKEKGMVLNKTNVNKICEILGTSETDEWFGGLIVIYPTEVEFSGAMTMAIRVRAPSANGATKPKPKPMREREPGDDDIPSEEDPFA
jgi:RNA polymerase subunit RPABC4/transcription elongation factor Spt4